MKQAFLDLSDPSNIAISIPEIAIKETEYIIEKEIEKALFDQLIKKASGPDRLNFKAL
jgi:hypothetical protein